MKNLLFAALLSIFGTSAIADGIGDMNDDERDTFRAEVRAYLLENPEVLMEAIAVLEQRQQQEQTSNDGAMIAANADAIFDDGYSYVGGNPDGDVTLVEFLDYRCSYCRRAHDEINELVTSDGNIRLVVKEFPILGEQSTIAARFAIATLHKAGPETYKQVADFLMTFNGNLGPKNMRAILNRFDADSDIILAYLDDEAVTQQINEIHGLASKLQIRGTPTFVIGQQLLRGYAPLETMQAIVAHVREQNQ